MMNKLIKAALGAGAEFGDRIADRQAFHTLEWELRSVDKALAAAQRDLTVVMAMEIAEQRRVQALSVRIASDEVLAQRAIRAREDGLAAELAARIAELRDKRDARAGLRDRHADRVREMREAIAAMEERVTELRRDFAAERATAALQRVEQIAGERGSLVAAGLAEAEATLHRIKQRQQEHADRLSAIAALAGDRRGNGLDARLRHAGLAAPDRAAPAAVLEELRRRALPAPAETTAHTPVRSERP